ncbi:hypothetical protein [Clostridium tyrobutyricum]|uniref:hypothetical protein n=1 Tax=Clostridium tyrobutyricum TaxID=1519 RepID=UPI0002D4745D|nr:hypothetical protein [Clostridium tyrobutyricum]
MDSYLSLLNSFEKYISDYKKNLQNIIFTINNIDKNKKIIIYGGGIHTQELLLHTNLSKKNIIGIVDKNIYVDSEEQYMGKYNMFNPKIINSVNPDVIVISSYKYQNQIYDFLKNSINFKGEIIRLYKIYDRCAFYNFAQNLTDLENREKLNFTGKYVFINRSMNRNNLLIVLAGYKEYLWDDTFERIKAFVDDDIDVCIVLSGVQSKKILRMCSENNWSYVETEEDKLSLGQNIAIKKHPNASYIYKIDEDIFITKNFFSKLKDTYLKVKDENKYEIGFVAPLMPVNGYCYRRFIEIFNLLNEYEKKFGNALYSCMGIPPHINGDAAIWLWEKSSPIDKSNELLNNMEFRYSICFHRFSIGAIMIRREFWEEINGFKVGFIGNMGVEEKDICEYCMNNSRAIVVSENVLVGHFAFGPQNLKMMQYYFNNRKKFKLL